jgi:sugar lactone lactonase YvrE
MLKGDQRAETVPIEGAERLNDMAAFGDEVFVSDTAKGRIHAIRVDAPREQRLIPSPSGINGLAFSKDAMWGVSWSEHDIYLLDRAGKKPPKALGLAAHFTNLDGIEVLPDGQLVVSDFVGNKVCVVNTATKAVKTLIETQTPADIGWDEAGKMLYVPIFEHDRVEIYQLTER